MKVVREELTNKLTNSCRSVTYGREQSDAKLGTSHTPSPPVHTHTARGLGGNDSRDSSASPVNAPPLIIVASSNLWGNAQGIYHINAFPCPGLRRQVRLGWRKGNNNFLIIGKLSPSSWIVSNLVVFTFVGRFDSGEVGGGSE